MGESDSWAGVWHPGFCPSLRGLPDKFLPSLGLSLPIWKEGSVCDPTSMQHKRCFKTSFLAMKGLGAAPWKQVPRRGLLVGGVLDEVWGTGWEGWGCRAVQRQKLNCDTVSAEASAGPTGHARAPIR